MRFTYLTSMICGAFAAGILTAAPESLHFETKTIAITLEPGTEQTEITYPFENQSANTVEIERHQAPCTCIKSQFRDNKTTYAPGEKGALIVTFNTGNLFGTVEKQVVAWLKGDAADKPSLVLTAKITIPELVLIEPRSLHWGIQEPLTPKTCKITTHHKDPIRIVEVVTTNNQFHPELKTFREGWEYEITVTPSSTAETSFGIIKITSDCSMPRFRRTSLFAMIKPEEKKE